MVTIKQIAERVGKTEAAVSMALNNKPGVSEETRKMIKQVAANMGYVPNIIARELSTSATYTVGLIVPTLSNPFFANLAGYVNDFLSQKGYKLLLTITNQSKLAEYTAVSDMISRHVDGIIIVPVTDETEKPDYEVMLTRSAVPYVYATSYYLSMESKRIMTDLAKGEAMAVEYLLKTGHRRIMFLGTRVESPSNSLRIRGANDACRTMGYDPAEILRLESVAFPEFKDAYAFVGDLVRRNDLRQTAIVTLNDSMALGALKALQENGIAVPEEISIIGYDNLMYSEIATVPLTTVEQDIGRIAEKSVENILNGGWMIRDTLYLPPRLILRSSVKTKNTNGNTDNT